jgi:hypothetical protein
MVSLRSQKYVLAQLNAYSYVFTDGGGTPTVT